METGVIKGATEKFWPGSIANAADNSEQQLTLGQREDIMAVLQVLSSVVADWLAV